MVFLLDIMLDFCCFVELEVGFDFEVCVSLVYSFGVFNWFGVFGFVGVILDFFVGVSYFVGFFVVGRI